MLYVTWGKSKVNGLAGLATGETLKLNMSEAKLKTGTAVRVGSFAYNPDPTTIGGKLNPHWNAVDPGTIWTNYLEDQSKQAYQQLPPAARQNLDDEKFQQGALSLYLNLARGVEIRTDFKSAVEDNKDTIKGMIDEFGAAASNAGENAIGAMISVVDDFKEAAQKINNSKASAGTAKLLGKLAGKDVKNLANVKDALTSSKWAKGIGTTAVTFAGLSATVSMVLAFKDQLGLGEGAVAALEAVNATMGAVLAGLQVAQEITKVVQAVQAFSGTAMQGLKTALTFSSEVSKVGAIAAIVVVAVIVVVALVMFFKLLSDGNPVAAKTALAQGVGTAVVVLLLFVISIFFPIGTAIALIVGLLDGIFTAICKIANWVGGKDKDGKSFEDRNKTFCSGIVGNTVAAIAAWFYKTKPMVDMSDKGRLRLGQTDTKLIERNGLVGLSADNQLEIKQLMTTTVRLPEALLLNPRQFDPALDRIVTFSNHIGIDGALMPTSEYDRLIKEKSLFNYELVTSSETAANATLAKQTTPGDWKSVGVPTSRDRLYKTALATVQITLTAGINWKPELQVREYYRFPLAECGLFAGGGCDYKFDQFTKQESGQKDLLDLGKHLIYDIFPSTLTGFYTLEQVQENGQFVNRYRLAWGGKDKPFPTLLDADGDGLRSDGTGALDPDDKTGDKDNDGLPDAFELQDYRLNPSAGDSDQDGLADYQEIRYGTRPDRADSDNDGLNDGDEINGWEFVYADADNVTKRTWVTADPLLADTDGDGFSDGQERVFAFHPRARTLDPQILTLRTSTNQSNSTYLAPQQSIAFTSTVKNELHKPIAYGLLEAEILNAAGAINPVTFELQPQTATNINGTISVPATPPNATNDAITLRNRAGANMVDPSATYASQLQGLAQPDGLKFQLNFEQRQTDKHNFQDVTGNATLTCPEGYCPEVLHQTNSYATFQADGWYLAAGDQLAFSQPKFSLGGWVTLRKAFGEEYSERVIFGPDNSSGAVEQYLQLAVVDLDTDTPKAKLSFTATDGTSCEQILTALTLPYEQKLHLFVTYDGTVVRGYKNGLEVDSYNLQNCTGKVPDGNRFTIGRGASQAKLYVDNVYYQRLDEGNSPLSSWAEPYLQLNDETEPFASFKKVGNGETPGISEGLDLRNPTVGDDNSTVYLCEEDSGAKQGQCRSDSNFDSDDALGTVTIDPRHNGEYDMDWSSGNGEGDLRYNVQNNFFEGDLDDLRIYEQTLNAREISQLVNSGGLVYQLDEASGRTQFRNAGTDTTQLICQTPGNCPTSGLKGYGGQGVRFTGGTDQTLAIDKLRERFGSNFIVSFWLNPTQGQTTSGPVPLIRAGQGTEGYTLYATGQGTQTALNSRFMYSESGYGVIGGSGGNAFDLRCNGNEALVGLYGGAGNVVDGVGALCVAIDGAGNWQGEPRQAGTAGGGGGDGYDQRCDRNGAVVGFTGRSGGLVDQITLLCAPLGQDGYAETASRVARAPIGSNGGNEQDPRICPSNFPASGITGRAGRKIDAFGITCRDQFTGHSRTTIANGQWSHIALAQRDDTLLLYVNGQLQQTIWFGDPSRQQYRVNSGSPDLRLGSQLAGLLDEVQIFGLEGETDTAITAQVAALYTGSAAVYLAFDETTGSTTFANSTGKANLVCADAQSCPQAGVKGQVRESVLFNGPANAPTLAITDQRNASFSFSTWVKVPSVPVDTATLVALHEGTAESYNWRLQLTNKAGKVVPEVSVRLSSDGNSCDGSFTITPKDAGGNDLNLALNQWYHLGISYNPQHGNNDVSLYLNGQLAYQQRLDRLICRVGTTLRFGQNFKGQLDEFVFYPKALVVTEFLSQYVYQSSWYDVVTSEQFRVDYNAPTVKLTTNQYLKAGTTIFGVAVSDAESGIKGVEYKDNSGNWQSARSETATTGVWAFALDIQGSQTVEVRATDLVGNVRSDSKNVTVDSAPPTVALTTSGKQATLVVEGTASDSGSGLQSATIMLFDPLGNPMNSPRDLAVTNGTWRYSQPLPPVVNGTFQVWVGAVDQLGNHFAQVIGTVEVDNMAPVTGLLTDKVAYSGVGNALPTIQGFVTDHPLPDGMKLLLGFEDQPASGTINRTLDLAGNQWQAVPLPGSSGPAIVFSTPHHQADFQLGQTLTISNANPALGGRAFTVDPNSATISLWINPNATALGEQTLLSQRDQAGFGLILKGDQLILRINRNGTPLDKDTGQRVVAGQWQRLTLSFDRSKAEEQTITTWLNPISGNNPGKALTLSLSELIAPSAQTLTLGAATNGYAGKVDDLLVYARPLSELEARQLTNPALSLVQSVEVGFLHRQDKDDPSKIIWQSATLATPDQAATTWQVQVPAGLEGIYDISLRTSDTLNNQRVVGGIWTGVIDTLAPRIALSGAGAGQQQCLVTDFSLSTATFICAEAQTASGATSANYDVGSLIAAGLSWDTQWYKALFVNTTLPARLYALHQGGRNFTSSNTAESCDLYGNCTRCTVSDNNLAAPVCTVSVANTQARAAITAAANTADKTLVAAEVAGPAFFTTTVAYERPDAYVPGSEPGAPTASWVTISEPYTLIDDAVLAATRPFAASYQTANTAIAWGESLSATTYYVGWTLTETVVISDLTSYPTPDYHQQTLPDGGRYYAHVVAVDAAGAQNSYTLGPVYFDGAPPPTYLNWDEDGANQPYWLWQDALSATGQVCNLLGVEDRAGIYSNGTSPRSQTQSLYGTWNNEWLALHWDGIDLDAHGDLHLYLDTKSGGSLYAYNPYESIDQATTLVTMPERRQYESNAVDRMLADFGVIVEDGSNIRFLQWDGAAWQMADAGQLRFQYSANEAIIWLPLATLGANPAAIDLSLVGFVTEEERMQVWATMPGNNGLNSPELLPEHAPAAIAVGNTLVNLQTSMRLAADPSVNNTLDNCPTNVLFDESVLDIQFMAAPAGEVYDPVNYAGVRAVVPDDVEPLLAALCGGVSDTSNSPVCQLAQQVAANVGGGGPETGPNDLYPATAGPADELVYYATVRNLSHQDSGEIMLEVASDLPSNGMQLPVGILAPLESQVVSFTTQIDPNGAYDFTKVTIYPIETITNVEENIVLTYEHEPHTVIHDIDRTAPFSAALTSELINDVIGVGEQYLAGLVFDQSLVTEITLQTSLGETQLCTDTQQIDAFTSDWLCAINIPDNTPSGTQVTVNLRAKDEYGFTSGVIGNWSFVVDNTAPALSLFGEAALTAASLQATGGTTATLVLDGLAGDDQFLERVEVCDSLQGFANCQDAELSFFTAVFSDSVQAAAFAAPLADEAYWYLENTLPQGITQQTVPYTVTAYDRYGNQRALALDVIIDTLPPTVTLSTPPVPQIDYAGAFALAGTATDLGNVDQMELEVLTPLGEYEYYTITLATAASPATNWHYAPPAGSDQFAMPGSYSYWILAYDGAGNEREMGPFTLEIGEPATPLLHAPYFMTTTNDLWAGFAPGAPLYMVAYIDDADLALGDQLTVTAPSLPSWLTFNRLDTRTLEVSGTVPLTITQAVTPTVAVEAMTVEDAQREQERASLLASQLELNVTIVVTDRAGQQAYQSWDYTVVQSGPSTIFLPVILNKARSLQESVGEEKLFMPLINR